MVSKVLERKGEMLQAWGDIYKAVEQLVILYSREIWVVTG